MSEPEILVIGGGYGGIRAARELDGIAHVILVDPKDAFVHNVAALRGLVDEQWSHDLFIPYGHLLARGEVRRDRVVEFDGSTALLASGDALHPDYTVLATGSTSPFPARWEEVDSAHATQRLAQAREDLAGARSVLILGAGPVGLELAGEIRARWPHTGIDVLSRGSDILPGPLPHELRAEVGKQLADLRISLTVGATLESLPPTPEATLGTFEVRDGTGRSHSADIWFRCFGGTPSASYLTGTIRDSLVDGRLGVDEHLRVLGSSHVFAVGDLTAVAEPKMAKAAELHADVVAANIGALVGHGSLRAYTPGPPGISLPLGPDAGASYAHAVGVLGAEQTAQLKGRSLRIDLYRQALGIPLTEPVDG